MAPAVRPRPPPLWFEALPPRAGATPQTREAALAALAPLAGLVERVLVPDLPGGHYRTEDPARFAADVQDHLGVPAAVAVPTYEAEGRLAARLGAAWGAGLRHFLFVGPPDGAAGHTGADVNRALRRHAPAIRAAGGSVGVVTIPARRRVRLDEPHRLLDKQRAGADHAVSQILFEPEDALRLLEDRASLAPHEAPVPVVWSLAPVVQARDLRFLEGLGVHVPPGLRRWLDAAPDCATRLARSLEAAEATAAALALAQGPCGFCVSHVMAGNVPAAVELAARLARRVQPVRLAPGPSPSAPSAPAQSVAVLAGPSA